VDRQVVGQSHSMRKLAQLTFLLPVPQGRRTYRAKRRDSVRFGAVFGVVCFSMHPSALRFYARCFYLFWRTSSTTAFRNSLSSASKVS
jgi:hypothetical protein